MMFSSVCRVLVRSSKLVSCPTPYNVRFSPFSSSKAPKSISETAANIIDSNFAANYFIQNFGFSQNKALVASKYSVFDSPDKPESVIAFFKNRGLTSEEIGTIVRYFPTILCYDPLKTFMPKMDFFQSAGISPAEVNNIILIAPTSLVRSMENHILPIFNYIKTFFNSNGTSLRFTKHFAEIFRCSLDSVLIPNIEILIDAGVPKSRIVALLQNYPRAFMIEKEKFREVVKKVKQMEFNPSEGTFCLAVYALRSAGKLNWDKKMAAYRNWGLSENDISVAFRKKPFFMIISTDKIGSVMDFLVNEVGLDTSVVVNRPILMTFSLEKRLRPRYSVYKILVADGRMKNIPFPCTFFEMAERDFFRQGGATVRRGHSWAFAVLSAKYGRIEELNLLKHAACV